MFKGILCLAVCTLMALEAYAAAGDPPNGLPDLDGTSWTGKVSFKIYDQGATSKGGTPASAAKATSASYNATLTVAQAGFDLTGTIMTLTTTKKPITSYSIFMSGSEGGFTLELNGSGGYDNAGTFSMAGHVDAKVATMKGTGVVYGSGDMEEMTFSLKKVVAKSALLPQHAPAIRQTGSGPNGLPDLDNTNWTGTAKVTDYTLVQAGKAASKSYAMTAVISQPSGSALTVIIDFVNGAGPGANLEYTFTTGDIGAGVFAVDGVDPNGNDIVVVGFVSGKVGKYSIKGFAIDQDLSDLYQWTFALKQAAP